MRTDWSRADRKEGTRIWKQIGAGRKEEKELEYGNRLEQDGQKRRNQDMETDWSRTDRREETRILELIGAGRIEKKELRYGNRLEQDGQQ